MVRQFFLILIFCAVPCHAIELDADGNGAIDAIIGGTNAKSAAEARKNMGAASTVDLINHLKATNPHGIIDTHLTDSEVAAMGYKKVDTHLAAPDITSMGFIQSESDPSVQANVKDGVSWSELSGIPIGFADGIDNSSNGTEVDNTIYPTIVIANTATGYQVGGSLDALFPWVITKVQVLCDDIGTFVFDVWVGSKTVLPLDDNDSITGVNPLTVTNSRYNDNCTLSG